MTSVDFYILGQTQQQDRLTFTCRLTEKAWTEGHQVYIHVDSEEAAMELDALLWTYKPDSFVPHQLAGKVADGSCDVEIGWQQHPEHHKGVLINLVSPLPTFFSRFDRVLEVVIQEEAILKQTREHYKFYKDRGYTVTHRDLRG